MVRKIVASLVCAAMLTTGCASAGGPRIPPASPAPNAHDNAILGEYLQRLPAGSRIRIERRDGGSFRGTLMKATPDAIVVQKNTRVPEPPLEVPLSDVSRVTLESNTASLGRNIAIGIGSGVAATFGILFLLAALIGD